MKENRFSEKDSLELISQMIQQTRQNMDVGSGNLFLYYGYSAFAISLIVATLVYVTANPVWSAVWFLMFLPNLAIRMKQRGEKPQVVTYMDKAIGNTWTVVGTLFVLTAIALLLFGYATGRLNFVLMLPLSLLYAAIGTSITGVISNVRALVYTPLLAFFIGIYMLVELASGEAVTPGWHLLFGVSFVLMMVIPGHIINRKSVHQCSKN